MIMDRQTQQQKHGQHRPIVEVSSLAVGCTCCCRKSSSSKQLQRMKHQSIVVVATLSWWLMLGLWLLSLSSSKVMAAEMRNSFTNDIVSSGSSSVIVSSSSIASNNHRKNQTFPSSALRHHHHHHHSNKIRTSNSSNNDNNSGSLLSYRDMDDNVLYQMILQEAYDEWFDSQQQPQSPSQGTGTLIRKDHVTWDDIMTISQQQDQRHLQFGTNLCNSKARPCACTESELNKALAKAVGTNPTGSIFSLRPVRVCFGARIYLTKPINITGLAFRMLCYPWPIPSTCYVDGSKASFTTQAAFYGAPNDAFFFGKVMTDFTNTGNGGAFYLSGGNTRFIESQINYNTADKGAGIYATGPGTRVLSTLGLFMYGNSASEGGAMYITDGATLQLSGTGFASNYAQNIGATLLITNNSTASLSSIVFYNNTNKNGKGIGNDIYVDNTASNVACQFALPLGNNQFCDGNKNGILGNKTNCKTTAVSINKNSLRCQWMYRLVNQ